MSGARFLWADGSRQGELETLWRAGFPNDGPDYPASFYRRFLGSVLLPALEQQGRLICACALFPLTLRCGEERWAGVYLHGLATLPELRGQGLGAQLQRELEQRLPAEGIRFIALHPGSQRLWAYYRRLGYLPGIRRPVLRELKNGLSLGPACAPAADLMRRLLEAEQNARPCALERPRWFFDAAYAEWQKDSGGQLRTLLRNGEPQGYAFCLDGRPPLPLPAPPEAEREEFGLCRFLGEIPAAYRDHGPDLWLVLDE